MKNKFVISHTYGQLSGYVNFELELTNTNRQNLRSRTNVQLNFLFNVFMVFGQLEHQRHIYQWDLQFQEWKITQLKACKEVDSTNIFDMD